MKQYKSRAKTYHVDVEVNYAPYPSEAVRKEAYYTHAKLYLRAKERMLQETYQKKQMKQ